LRAGRSDGASAESDEDGVRDDEAREREREREGVIYLSRSLRAR
jgi:hypothetical protein